MCAWRPGHSNRTSDGASRSLDRGRGSAMMTNHEGCAHRQRLPPPCRGGLPGPHAIVDEPDQPAESWGSITYAEMAPAGPGPGRGARRNGHRRSANGSPIVSHNSARLLDRAVRCQRLRPGPRADQLPPRRRGGALHRRALRRARADRRSRAGRGAGRRRVRAQVRHRHRHRCPAANIAGRSPGSTTRTPRPPSTTPAAPRRGPRACSSPIATSG